jgi:MFS transporter, DHA1 family, tetracycline resistance protein
MTPEAANENLAQPEQKKPIDRSLVMAALIVFIDMLGMGLIVPIMPDLIMEIARVNLEESAQIGGYLLLAYALMQFAFAPFIGALSDQFGRRPVLLVTLLALGVNYMVMAMASTLGLIIAGRVVSGIMGATWAAANSCIADSTAPNKRGAAFGILAGAGAAGYVLGPAIGGIVGEFGTRLPFALAGSLALLGALIGYFFFKETLTVTNRRPIKWARANPLGVALVMARNKSILAFLVTLFFLQLSAQAHLSIWAFYGTEKFGWSPLMSGLTVSVYGILLVLAQSILTGHAIAKFGALQTAKFSLLFAVPSYLLIAMAPTTLNMMIGVCFGAVAGMTFPALQGIMTTKVSQNEQGELQAAIVSTIGLTAIVGPVVMTQLFSHFSDATGIYFPGAPFILAALLVLVAIVVLWRTHGVYSARDVAPK